MSTPLPFLSCILLAAGESKRLGSAKQLLDWNGVNLLTKVIGELDGISARFALKKEIIVVLGARYDEIFPTLSASKIITRNNLQWNQGVGSSISAGMKAVHPSTTAVLLSLCDQPLITKLHYEELLLEFISSTRGIAATNYGESSGVPAVFESKYFFELMTLNGEKGAKNIIQSNRGDVAIWECPEALIDIDTISDYDRAIAARD